MVTLGAVLSTVLIIVWVTIIEFPQASVTLYLLEVNSEQPDMVAASLTNATVGVEQLSASSITNKILGAGIAALQPVNVVLAGLVAVGFMVSVVLVMVWVTFLVVVTPLQTLVMV